MPHSRQELLEEEWLLIRHSGELPEIAFHSALHSLTQDPEGPRLKLCAEETHALFQAALTRYQEMLLRDLCLDKRRLTIYRGIKRAIFNWQRLVNFCRRQDWPCDDFRSVTAQAMLVLLREAERQPGMDDLALVFNCTLDELSRFTGELGIGQKQIPAAIRRLYPAKPAA